MFCAIRSKFYTKIETVNFKSHVLSGPTHISLRELWGSSGLRKCRIMEESQLQVWEAQLERRISWSDFYRPWALNPIFNVLFIHCICPILGVLWSFHFYFSSSLHCIQNILFAVKIFSSCVNSFPLMKQPISLHGLLALFQILKSPDCMPSTETQSLPHGDHLTKKIQPV